MVIILCVVVTVMLWLFFLYHMYLVSLGYTTSENFKASQTEYYLKKYKGFLKKWEALKIEDKPFKPAKKTLDYYQIKSEDLSLEQIQAEIKVAQK